MHSVHQEAIIVSNTLAHWLLTVLLLLTAVALIIFLPGIWGFIALGLAAVLAPIPRWQELLSRTVDIRMVAVMALTALAVVMCIVTVTDSLQPSEPSLETWQPTTDPFTAPTDTPVPTEFPEPDPEPTQVATTLTQTDPVEVTTEFPTPPTTQPEPPTTQPAPSTKPPEPPPTQTVTSATDPSEERRDCDYVLNTKTKKFHDPDCGSVKQMKDENRESYTGSREALLADGYTPCGRCKP